MANRLAGIFIPVATPFAASDESFDPAALVHNLGQWEQTDVAGYMVLGTNGEFQSLDDDEARLVVEAAADHKGDKTLIVGAGRESTRQTIRFIETLAPWYDRIDYISVLTPNYFAKLIDARALLGFYTEIADACPLPVLAYVAPGYANGVTIPAATLARLADHPNIHGIKDTSPAMLVDYLTAVGGREDFEVLAGSLNNIMTCLALGGRGGVVSAANYLPQECARLIELYDSVPTEQAMRYYRLLRRVASSGGGKQGVASLKAAMNARGYRAGVPRRPLLPISPASDAELRAALEAGLPVLHDFGQ